MKHEQEILEALKQGKSYTTIQNELGVYPVQISRVKKKYGVATITTNVINITTNNGATTNRKRATNKKRGSSSQALTIVAHLTNGVVDKYYSSGNWVATPEVATHYTTTDAIQIVRGLCLKAPANSDGRQLILLQAVVEGSGRPKRLLDLGGKVRKLGTGGVVVPAAKGWFTTNRTCNRCKVYSGSEFLPVRLLLTTELANRGYSGICPKCGNMLLR